MRLTFPLFENESYQKGKIMKRQDKIRAIAYLLSFVMLWAFSSRSLAHLPAYE